MKRRLGVRKWQVASLLLNGTTNSTDHRLGNARLTREPYKRANTIDMGSESWPVTLASTL